MISWALNSRRWSESQLDQPLLFHKKWSMRAREPALTSFLNIQPPCLISHFRNAIAFIRAVSRGNSVHWYWKDVRLATAERIDGNRVESRSDDDLVEAALTLSSCEHEGHSHQTSWTLSAIDECSGTPRVITECLRWVRRNQKVPMKSNVGGSSSGHLVCRCTVFLTSR